MKKSRGTAVMGMIGQKLLSGGSIAGASDPQKRKGSDHGDQHITGRKVMRPLGEIPEVNGVNCWKAKPNGQANQQPSRSKGDEKVDRKAQRLTGEDNPTNKPDTSAPHRMCNAVMI